MSLNAAIIGPGRSNQGTGPYIAKTFHELGVTIRGVVSSSLESATTGAKDLLKNHAINCPAYSSLHELLKNNPVDIIAICSPSLAHRQYLQLGIQAGCHIFCEKPLWWPASDVATEWDVRQITAQTTKFVTLCKNKNLVLQLNTQWPFTLPAYYEIFPPTEKAWPTIETFSMWLTPQNTNKEMIVDAAPHLLSMLYAMVGAGRIEKIETTCKKDDGAYRSMEIEFNYLHASGETRVSLALAPSDVMPKPAAYAINNQPVNRHVEISNYLISLQTSAVQNPIADPLVCSIKNFLSAIHTKSSPDEVALIDGMTHLAQIYRTIN